MGGRLTEAQRRVHEQDRWHKRGFAQGIAVACSTLVGTWGEEVAAEEIMAGAGLCTRAAMKRLGVDEYDLDTLAPIFRTRARKARRAGRRALAERREK